MLGRAGVEVGAGKKLAGTVSTMTNGAEGEEATTAAGEKETIIAAVDAGTTYMLRFIIGWDGASVKVAPIALLLSSQSPFQK